MSIICCRPWSALRSIHEKMNDAFDCSMTEKTARQVSQWKPHVNIIEKSDCYIVTADIPGVAPKDIDITLEHTLLTIRGTKQVEDINSISDVSTARLKQQMNALDAIVNGKTHGVGNPLRSSLVDWPREHSVEFFWGVRGNSIGHVLSSS